MQTKVPCGECLFSLKWDKCRCALMRDPDTGTFREVNPDEVRDQCPKTEREYD